jgi:hypothetical protein
MPVPIFVVQLTVSADREAEWNDWYNTVHVPEVMGASRSITSATRYRLLEGDIAHQYLAVYQFEDEQGLREFMQSSRLAQMSADYTRDWGQVSDRRRGAFVPLLQVTRQDDD